MHRCGRAFLTVYLLTTVAVVGNPLENWRWRNPLPQANNLHSVAYGNGKFVAVGERGVVLTSVDAVNWIPQDSRTTSNLNCLIFENGTFMGVGDSGSLLTSTNGKEWNLLSIPAGSLNSLCYGTNIYVAVGTSGTIITSPDGKIWTRRNSNLSYNTHLKAVAYGEGLFVAVGRNGGMAVSPDGINWTNRSWTSTETLQSLTFGNNRFVMLGSAFGPRFSTNGLDWEGAEYIGLTECLGFGAGKFIIVARSASHFSDDGATWSRHESSGLHEPMAVGYGNGMFVVAGWNGELSISQDGIIWTNQNSGARESFTSIVFGNDTYIAGVTGDIGGVAGENTYTVRSSKDGITWTNGLFTGHLFRSLDFLNGRFIGCGLTAFGSSIATSDDGLTWSNQFEKPIENVLGSFWINAVAYGNGVYAAAGNADQLVISSDAVKWTNILEQSGNSFSATNLNGIAFGQGKFVTVGDYYGGGPFPLVTIIGCSTNALDWEFSALTNFPQLSSVAFGKGHFVAVGGGTGFIAFSTDGENWTASFTESSETLHRIIFDNGIFLAVGKQGSMVYSTTGTNWLRPKPLSAKNLNDAIYANGSFYCVGDSGSILQSDDFRQPKISLQKQQNQFQFLAFGENGKSYRVQTSQNLAVWKDWISIVATPEIEALDSAPADAKFYQVVSP